MSLTPSFAVTSRVAAALLVLGASGLALANEPGANVRGQPRPLGEIRRVTELPHPPTIPRFSQRMGVGEANQFLRRWGFNAQVKPRRGNQTSLVSGRRSIRLPSVSQSSLHRALTRLGLRSRSNPLTLAELQTELDAGRTDRTWTEGSHTVSDFLGARTSHVARTAVDPRYLGAPIDVPTVLVESSNLHTERAENLDASLNAYIDRALGALRQDGRFAFPVHPEQASLIAGERGTPVRGQVTTSDRTFGVGEFRWKLDLRGVQSVNSTKPIDLATARRDIRRWGAIHHLIQRDPQLRVYASTQPELAIVATRDRGVANILRSTTPYPAHPQHPEGTLAVGLKSLVTRVGGNEPTMLRTAIENRHSDLNELHYMVDTFIRPMVKVFRVMVDRYGLALFNLHEKNLSFEFTTAGGPTGRVVLNDFGDVWPDENLMRARSTAHLAESLGAVDTSRAGLLPLLDAPRNLVHYGLNTLYDSIGALAASFHRDFGRAGFTRAEIRRAVDAAVTEELRYLRPDTARLLGRDTVMGRFVHSVPEHQQQTLTRVLESVRAIEDGVVIIDLDHTGLVPRERVLAGLRKVGRELGISELARRPERLRVGATPWSAGEEALPKYTRESFSTYWQRTGLEARHGSPERAFKIFEDAYFTEDAYHTDVVEPGLASFVRQIQRAGGRVVFVSGRRERHRAASMDSLRRAGIMNPEFRLVPNEATGSTAAEKEKLLGTIPGTVVAMVDDILSNLDVATRAAPNALRVLMQHPGYVHEHVPTGEGGVAPEHRIVSFDTAPPRETFSRPAANVRNFISDPESLGKMDRVARSTVNPETDHHRATLNRTQTRAVVRRLVDGLERQVPAVVQSARERAHGAPEWAGLATDRERLAFELFHLINAEPQIAAGSEGNLTWAEMKPRLLGFLERGEPIRFVMPSFPVKEHKNRMKALGYLPDMAELGALVRIRTLDRAVRALYDRGIQFTILSDGHHYRPHFLEPPTLAEGYMNKVNEFIDLIDARSAIRLVDYDRHARSVLGPEVWSRRLARLNDFRSEYRRAFRGIDVTANPERALQLADEHSPTRGDSRTPRFSDLFGSMAFMIWVPPKPGVNFQRWSRDVMGDLYNVTNPSVDPALLEARKQVLRRAWNTTIGYLSAVRADREVGFSDVEPNAIRATIHPKPGQYGFELMRSSSTANSPWHSTAAFAENGELTMDMAISLQTAGFVPVYSEILGTEQPLFFVPSQATQGGALSSAFTRRMHLMQ